MRERVLVDTLGREGVVNIGEGHDATAKRGGGADQTVWVTGPVPSFVMRGGDLAGHLQGLFRPLYVSASPEIDAYRIFCAELAGPAGEEPPNLAVVHIAAAKERGGLAERLTRAEQEAGVRALPVLMMSPAGQTVLDDVSIAGRKWQVLSTPTPVSRIIAAVNALIEREAVRTAA